MNALIKIIAQLVGDALRFVVLALEVSCGASSDSSGATSADLAHVGGKSALIEYYLTT